MFLRSPRDATRQPQRAATVNWANPVAAGLVACAYPVGNNFYEAVTREYSTKSTTTFGLRAPAGGKSLNSACVVGISGGSAGSNVISWASSLTRGAELTTEGTVLCLGGTNAQVDGNIYALGGNTDSLSVGAGFAIAIDSNQMSNKGDLIRMDYTATKGWSAASLLGTTFGPGMTHFSGYSYKAAGENGTWWSGSAPEAWSAATTHNTGQATRQLCVFGAAYNGGGNNDTFVGLLLLWKRALSVAEFNKLYSNPWQLLLGN
jgi:hypothetical protein